MRGLHESDLVYSFGQIFSDGSQRMINITTRMANEESLDTLIVQESVHGPDGMMAWVRTLPGACWTAVE